MTTATTRIFSLCLLLLCACGDGAPDTRPAGGRGTFPAGLDTILRITR